MKRIIFGGFATTLLALLIGVISYGQVDITSPRSSNDIPPAGSSISKNFSSSVDRNNLKSRTVRNFGRSYKNISSEKWYEVPDGFIAGFILDDINYRVDYDKRGNWLHTIRTYNENKLPPDVRHLVKSSYYDYNITLVQEIEQPRYNFTYIIHLEGKTEFFNLRVHDGEMEEWQKLVKSK